MPHNLTERDGMFTVRQPAWHNLGEVLPEYPTREQAQKIAHPWEPISEPIYRKVPEILADGSLTETYEEITGYQAAVRSDDGHTLGVNSETYTLVPNSEMYDIAEAIEGEAKGSVMFETGGSLKGGAKVWLLVRLREPIVLGGDPLTATIPYFALQNSHDGSGAFRGQALLTRIVCDNTSQAADYEAEKRGTEFVFRHTSSVGERIEEAKNALTGWREGVREYRLTCEHLLDVKVTSWQADNFIEQFIPMPPPHVTSERVLRNVVDARQVFSSVLYGETNESINNTAYGLVQASVEYLNHYRAARSAETRFRRAYLDRNRIVTDAVELALAVAR